MAVAYTEAEKAAARGEVPIGAVVVGSSGEILGQAGNSSIELCDPSAHAEILAIRKAGQHANNYRLADCSLYVTLEPCPMCMGAIIHARIEKVVFGATDPKTGALVSKYKIGQDGKLNHSVLFQHGLLAEKCSKILRDFFRGRRKNR